MNLNDFVWIYLMHEQKGKEKDILIKNIIFGGKRVRQGVWTCNFDQIRRHSNLLTPEVIAGIAHILVMIHNLKSRRLRRQPLYLKKKCIHYCIFFIVCGKNWRLRRQPVYLKINFLSTFFKMHFLSTFFILKIKAKCILLYLIGWLS
jgi:hypothetical protein